MRSWLVVLNIFLFWCLSAQQYPIRNYNMENGLAHSSVYRIFQDNRGFMWFCTDYGVCSYDGKKFETPSNDSLLNGPVLSMSEDKSRNKLISSIKEGVLFMSDSSLRRYPFSGEWPHYVLYTEHYRNKLWVVGRERGNFLYKGSNSHLAPFNIVDSAGNPVAINKLIAYEDELLLPCGIGIYRVRDTLLESFLPGLVHENVADVKRSLDGTYWAAFNDRLVGIKNNQILFSYTMKPGQKIKNILCDKFNNVWIGLHKDGVLLLNNGIVKDITGRLNMNTTLINDIYEDREGNVWFATYNSGVYKLSTTELLNYSLNEHQVNFYCRALSQSNREDLLIGTIGKVYKWENDKTEALPLKSLQPDEFIYSIITTSNTLYVCTPRGPLIKRTDQVNAPEYRPGLDKHGALDVLIDHLNQVWVGGYSRLYRIDKQFNVCLDSNKLLLRHERFVTLIQGRDHTIWIGTKNGLIRFDGKNYYEVVLPKDKNLNTIHRLYEDSHNRIWAATLGGLICIDGTKTMIFTTADGLTHNKCNALIEDQSNTLWIGTLHGLSYINLDSMKVKPYSTAIYPDEILSLHCSQENRLYVGTANSLSSFSTSYKLPYQVPPPVYITSVKTNEGENKMPLRVNLKYDYNKLLIEFIGLSFQNANTIEYRYKLKGLTNKWFYTANSTIELPALPSGSYSFVLNARSNKGPWSKDVVLPIFISTPVWRSWPFYIGLLISFIGMIFLITRWQTKKIESRKQKKLALFNKELILQNKIAYLKQQALVALIKPHFIFNCMNSIQHFLNRNDKNKANNYLADFAHLIRMTIENAQEAFITLEEEIKRIKLYLSLEQLRFGEKLSYDVEVSDQLNPTSLSIPNMILQPYIENAIWHGIMPSKKTDGRIVITFKKNAEDELLISISDNGVGIKPTGTNNKKQRRRLGMALTEERLQLLKQLSGQNYRIMVETIPATQDGTGTTVEITLPILKVNPESLNTDAE